MNDKNYGSALLLLVAAAAMFYLLRQFIPLGEAADAQPSKIEASAASSPAQPDAQKVVNPNRVLVYYFHGNKRCMTCLTIEKLTASALESGFREELEKGEVEWRVVNVDSPENEQYIWKYNLTYRAVVVVRFLNGQEKEAKILNGIWQLVRDEDGFRNYIQSEVRSYLRSSGA